MIEWASPWAFALLVPVLLLPMQARWTGRNQLAVPSSSAMERRWTLRLALSWLPRVLQMVGLCLVVFALARPQILHRDVVSESEGLDILLAIDTSGSMKARDMAGPVGPNRLEVAKGVMAEFVDARPYDRIGLVVFGQEAFTFVPLTHDKQSLHDVLDLVQIGIAGGGATAIGAAIAVSGRRMKQVDAPERVIILLTDGRNNVERPDPRQAAQAAAALDIKIYTVGVGGPGGFFDAGPDEPALREIAATTGGQYFPAHDIRALRMIYDTIDELETSPAEVREYEDAEELFRDYLVPGLLLLGLQLLLSTTVLRRGP